MNESQTDGKVGNELLDELFSALEDLETQSAGILQFLKDKGLATEKDLAPYLEEAANASEVRWRAARLRMDALLAAAIHDAEEEFARKVEERSHKESTTGKKKEPSEGEGWEAGEDRNAQKRVRRRTRLQCLRVTRRPTPMSRENPRRKSVRPRKERKGKVHRSNPVERVLEKKRLEAARQIWRDFFAIADQWEGLADLEPRTRSRPAAAAKARKSSSRVISGTAWSMQDLRNQCVTEAGLATSRQYSGPQQPSPLPVARLNIE